MSERRNGGWDDLDVQNNQIDYSTNEYRVQEIYSDYNPRRNVRRNSGDNLREFFYWFGNNGGFRAIPRLVLIIAVIALVIWIVVNRNAILKGFIGLLSELIPIALLIWLLWVCLRGLINPNKHT